MGKPPSGATPTECCTASVRTAETPSAAMDAMFVRIEPSGVSSFTVTRNRTVCRSPGPMRSTPGRRVMFNPPVSAVVPFGRSATARLSKTVEPAT
jgi:hypothetical protein